MPEKLRSQTFDYDGETEEEIVSALDRKSV